MANAVVIEADSLKSRLVDWGLDLQRVEPYLPKKRYQVVNLNWLLEVFARDWAEWRRQIMSGYEDGTEVCDDYVLQAMAYARTCYRRWSDRVVGAEIMFGAWSYVKQLAAGADCGHAVCLVPMLQINDLVPAFWDPQEPTKLAELSTPERNSCEFCRF